MANFGVDHRTPENLSVLLQGVLCVLTLIAAGEGGERPPFLPRLHRLQGWCALHGPR